MPAPRLWPWLVVAAVLTTVRTLVFVTHPTISFDADQAVVGLMAKHIAEGRAWPVYQYALDYVFEVTAYLVAPFMWVLGPTLTALRLPMLLMNVGVGVGLVALVARAGVRPALATLAAVPVLLAPPATSAALMDALGMTIEPLAFVLAIWWLRDRPVLLGGVIAVGVRVREFVAYGAAALLVVEILSGRLRRPDAVERWTLTAATAAGTLALLAGLARFQTPLGPGTWVDAPADDLATLSGAFCFQPAWAARNVGALVTRYLGELYGAVRLPVEAAVVRSDVVQGATGLWVLVGGALVVMLAVSTWRLRDLWTARARADVGLGVFLAAVGLQAVVVYALSRCGPLSVLTLRYALLGLVLPTGLVVLFLAVETRTRVRVAALAAFVVLGAVSLRDHAALLREQWTEPHVANRVRLAAALEARGVRYAYADYWTAYYVAFITEERVLVVPDVLSRIAFYEREVAAHAHEAVRLSPAPCGEDPPVAPGYHVCDATR